MTKTIIGTYSSLETATAVVNDLVKAGFHRNSISVVADDPDERYAAYVDKRVDGDDAAKGAGIGAAIGGLGGLLLGLGALAIPGIGPIIAAGPIAAALAGAGVGAVTGGIIGALVDLGVPEDSAELYAESVRRGNSLVIAQVEDNRANEATRIMQRSGLIDIDREAETWRASGWKGFDATATDYDNTIDRQRVSATYPVRDDIDDETIEVVEEDIHVGKRAVESGGVRVKSYIREVPVEEEVTLRQESVEIERRPVDRPAKPGDLDTFQEGTIEVREMHEEAVVAKDARVVEEVHVRKNVQERTEKVQDTVRKTEVEVEQMGSTGRTVTNGGPYKSTGFGAYDVYDPDFRTHYQTSYSGLGKYQRYEPAYRYGYTLATDDRYRGLGWGEVEPQARKAWNAQNQNSWEDFKDAVQYAWDKVTGKF